MRYRRLSPACQAHVCQLGSIHGQTNENVREKSSVHGACRLGALRKDLERALDESHSERGAGSQHKSGDSRSAGMGVERKRMNAGDAEKLADELETSASTMRFVNLHHLLMRAATMLREQQKDLEAFNQAEDVRALPLPGDDDGKTKP
jgi:hypothetical protein